MKVLISKRNLFGSDCNLCWCLLYCYFIWYLIICWTYECGNIVIVVDGLGLLRYLFEYEKGIDFSSSILITVDFDTNNSHNTNRILPKECCTNNFTSRSGETYHVGRNDKHLVVADWNSIASKRTTAILLGNWNLILPGSYFCSLVDALPSVSPIDSRLSVARSCVSSPESSGSPLSGSAILRDPCPQLCPCRIGSGCLCRSSRLRDIPSGPDTFSAHQSSWFFTRFSSDRSFSISVPMDLT